MDIRIGVPGATPRGHAKRFRSVTPWLRLELFASSASGGLVCSHKGT